MVFNLYQAGYNVKLSIMAPLSPTAVLAIWHSTSIQIIIHTTKKSSFLRGFLCLYGAVMWFAPPDNCRKLVV